ncbi:DUF4105 domain-containing protein [Lysobacter sp. CFH 32150]|uniref:lipoprotein N-acyltransferase Lnb domain-containing protein n=1 Tax=Lysobacter sp. CFH 32150 TaxID=2927128 RepID=UPI001FA73A69|nr:DUF4105 domain-containing protein [Lysobacter sp. CFH 32150]MCI4566992.1 DUF4105 domain-containing protein [Lysobacter sp. CFH 32150]
MPTTSRVALLLSAVLLWLLAATVSAAPRIGVATMQPGEIFWERFGHNAIVVDDPARGEPLSYNFGFFDLDEPDFFRRFIRGEMSYRLMELPLRQDMEYYREVGRGVSLQWLDLTSTQATQLAAALAENAKPENARYRYDYFTDNCSTRVRDALDRALGGTLRQQMISRSQGNTYRSEAVRLASPAGWMWLGFDLGLGPFADRPLSRWQEAFVPMRLADSLRETKLADGRPLVTSEYVLLPHRIAPEPAETPRRWWPYALVGIALAFTILRVGKRRPRLLAAMALPFWTLSGLLGLLLAFIWCCTAHRAGWANHNLLLLNPLCLLLLPGALRVVRDHDPGPRFRRWLGGIAACALVALALQLLPNAQYAAPWIALLLPVHLALAHQRTVGAT